MELVGAKHALEAKPSSAAVKHLHVVIEVGTSFLRNSASPFKADGSPEPLRIHLAAAMFCRERDVSREEALGHKLILSSKSRMRRVGECGGAEQHIQPV